jgi:2,4-dienoyl-CoA reductase-like NADH-dependent reductase (Old Yellow Enzyme family)
MSQNSAGPDGRATDWHLVHYGSRAVGGCGLILVEDTGVTADGRVSSKGLGLYDDDQIAPLKRIVAFCHTQKAAVGIQLAHAGRKALRDLRGQGAMLVAPSAIAFQPEWSVPRQADEDDLTQIVQAFAAAALRARKAGFDIIELHAAHGYLLHQFLSPVVNRRQDRYGGSLENRMRLLLRVIEEMRRVWPAERILYLRLPAADGVPGGLVADDIAAIARAAARIGIDLIDVAGSNITTEAPPLARDTLHETARLLRDGGMVGVAVGAAGNTGYDADQAIRSGICDLVTVGRPLLATPYWALDAATDLGHSKPLPLQYKDALIIKDARRKNVSA